MNTGESDSSAVNTYRPNNCFVATLTLCLGIHCTYNGPLERILYCNVAVIVGVNGDGRHDLNHILYPVTFKHPRPEDPLYYRSVSL